MDNFFTNNHNSNIFSIKIKQSLPIVIYPHPILRQKTEDIKDPTKPEIQQLIQSMLITMKNNNGLGLAAPQINQAKNLCVIDFQNKIYILINPKITFFSREKNRAEEGCLSFPGKFLNVKRSNKISLQYLTVSGKRKKLMAEGMLARIIQHEVDHLQGKLFIDYTNSK